MPTLSAAHHQRGAPWLSAALFERNGRKRFFISLVLVGAVCFLLLSQQRSVDGEEKVRDPGRLRSRALFAYGHSRRPAAKP